MLGNIPCCFSGCFLLCCFTCSLKPMSDNEGREAKVVKLFGVDVEVDGNKKEESRSDRRNDDDERKRKRRDEDDRGRSVDREAKHSRHSPSPYRRDSHSDSKEPKELLFAIQKEEDYADLLEEMK